MTLMQRFSMILASAVIGLLSPTQAADYSHLLQSAEQEKTQFLETLKELVNIESGSTDLEGLDKISRLIADRLTKLGGTVVVIDPSDQVYRMNDTPDKIGKIIRADFSGTGKGKVLLLAHMDTVYKKGQLAKQPFQIKGNQAYGLGIADDKQGIAVILHSLALLKSSGVKKYGKITVMINGDEEISSPGSRSFITKLAKEYDAVMSFEATRHNSDKLALATSGIAGAILKIQGKAAHSGFDPEAGVNALYELAHQVLQARDLSDADRGIKVNWTLASAGATRNVIPATATASADVRVTKVADYSDVEEKLRQRIKNQLLSEAKVEMDFERRRPPLEAKPVSIEFAKRAQAIYKEINRTLEIDTKPEGGGTDAAFAGLESSAPVVERMGIQGFGAHSNDDEYVLIDSIAPRLYLTTRMLMEVGK